LSSLATDSNSTVGSILGRWMTFGVRPTRVVVVPIDANNDNWIVIEPETRDFITL
jgi:hypothetical protein